MDVIVPTRNSIASVARNLNDKTDTIFHYSHTPLKKWFIVLSILCIVPGCSIMETSLQTDIPYYICYRFVRTVMERIASSSSKSDNVKLTGVIEADEFYIKAGLKGRPYHDEILNSGRLLPRERGLKAWKGRGTFEKDTPMIMCVHQRVRNDIF